MDVGCYGVSALRLICGAEPERVTGEQVSRSGVDARFAGVLRFPGDVLGSFDCGMDVHRRNFIEVVGSEATIEVPSPWQTPESALILVHREGETERIEPETVDPYTRELEEFGRAVDGGPPPRLGRADAVSQARAIEALYRARGRGARGQPVTATGSGRTITRVGDRDDVADGQFRERRVRAGAPHVRLAPRAPGASTARSRDRREPAHGA